MGNAACERPNEISHHDNSDLGCVAVGMEGRPKHGVVEGVVGERTDELPVAGSNQGAGFGDACAHRRGGLGQRGATPLDSAVVVDRPPSRAL